MDSLKDENVYSLSLQGHHEDHAVETVGFEAQQRIPTSRDNIVSLESVDTYEAGRATILCFQVAGFINNNTTSLMLTGLLTGVSR